MLCSMFRDVLIVNWIPFGASLMKKCGGEKRDYLQISYAHDSRHFELGELSFNYVQRVSELWINDLSYCI